MKHKQIKKSFINLSIYILKVQCRLIYDSCFMTVVFSVRLKELYFGYTVYMELSK